MIYYVLVLHFVADFLLQSREMGQKKSSDLEFLLRHLAIQFLVLWVGIGYFDPMKGYLFALINTLIHGIIDWNMWKFYKWSVHWRYPDATAATWEYWKDKMFYTVIGLDQMLHVATLIGAGRFVGLF